MLKLTLWKTQVIVALIDFPSDTKLVGRAIEKQKIYMGKETQHCLSYWFSNKTYPVETKKPYVSVSFRHFLFKASVDQFSNRPRCQY